MPALEGLEPKMKQKSRFDLDPGQSVESDFQIFSQAPILVDLIKQKLRTACSVNSCIVALLLCMVSCNCAIAQTSDTFLLGRIKWKIPTSYIYQRSQKGGQLTAISLEFSLPSFGPESSKDLTRVISEEAKPTLFVTIDTKQNGVVGQALLNQIIAHAEVNCLTCVKDSSLGGKIYSNYAIQKFPYQDINNGIPYNLYVNKLPSGSWFMACYFKPDLTPLPCEVKERLGKVLTLTYEFPQEYISQAFKMGAQLRIILAKFQIPEGVVSAEDAAALRQKTKCWSPTPGSPGDKTVPLQVGPELWRIPIAYAKTFGSNQTHDPKVNGFQIFLKLPDLEPLATSDASPFEIHGVGDYINIFITYKDRAMDDESSAFKIDQNKRLVLANITSRYVGQNAFINYEERMILNFGNITYISNDPIVNNSSFPPKLFDCGQFSPAYNPICGFYVERKSNMKFPESPYAGYQIQYGFSREYFAEIAPISECVRRLYEALSGSAEH